MTTYICLQIHVKDEPWFERTKNTGWYMIDEVTDFTEPDWEALNAIMARRMPLPRKGESS